MDHDPSSTNLAVHAPVVVFQAGGLAAIPAAAVREIVAMASLAHAPGQPSVLEGFLNLRRQAVPVIRVGRLFDLPQAPPGLYAHAIVLRGGPQPSALLVDRVTAVYTPRKEDWLPIADNSSFNRCAEAQLITPVGVAHFLSCDRLLLEKERLSIAELQVRAQQYLEELETAGA